MDIGKKIRKVLLDKEVSQKWLSDKSGIPYDRLNQSLKGRRTLGYDELAQVLWALNMNASDFITPTPPKQQKAS